ncbi:MAG: TIGR04255 family protein [Desulfuromonadales bacterium]|nr:TIGR04255 family protein [Desulfuromonadales bacterium]
MGKKMNNAPVYFTVAQVRFNPILNMEGYLPNIQERMRATRFPDFKRGTIQKLTVQFGSPGDGGQAPIPTFAPQTRCIFGNIDRTTEFVLEHNALALQTTAYDVSDTFFNVLLDGLSIIHDILRLDFTERVGLRYFDAVLPKSDESLSDYLAPEVLGLSHNLGGTLSHSYSETVTMNTSGQLVSRVVIQDGHVGLPPEVMSLAPQINPKFTEPEGRHAIIDTDAFCEQRDAFSLESLGSKLVALHGEIEKSFKKTVTPFAIKVWE